MQNSCTKKAVTYNKMDKIADKISIKNGHDVTFWTDRLDEFSATRGINLSEITRQFTD